MTQKIGRERRGLGRGLGSLLGGEETSRLRSVPIEQIVPGQNQPRSLFEQTELEQLAESIGHHGVLQPLLLRPAGTGDTAYEIVAGERRWRAAQLAGLHELPALIEEMEEPRALAVALIENVQRADLTPVEEAEGYRRLLSDHRYTQKTLARLVGKSRSHIANTTRLLSLSAAIRQHLQSGQLSAGHGRALLAASEPEVLAQRVLAEGLSVRETEELVRREQETGPVRPRRPRRRLDPNLRAVEKSLGESLGARVKITQKTPERGAMIIQYTSLRQLDRLLEFLSVGAGFARPDPREDDPGPDNQDPD